jgi:hypothetical protein
MDIRKPSVILDSYQTGHILFVFLYFLRGYSRYWIKSMILVSYKQDIFVYFCELKKMQIPLCTKFLKEFQKG